MDQISFFLSRILAADPIRMTREMCRRKKGLKSREGRRMARSPRSLFNIAGVRITFLLCAMVAVGFWIATTQADLLAGDRGRPQNVDKTDSTQATSLPLQQLAS